MGKLKPVRARGQEDLTLNLEHSGLVGEAALGCGSTSIFGRTWGFPQPAAYRYIDRGLKTTPSADLESDDACVTRRLV